MRRRDALMALASTATVSACGTLPREDFPLDRMVAGQPSGMAGVRTSAARAGDLGVAAVLEARARRGPVAILALSGGGANGAFGAGVLCGWTAAGSRPAFDLVTGVSTGALAAPFAFLGPSWDDRLHDAYAGGVSSGLLSFRRLSPFKAPGLFSQAPLRELVGRYLDARLLDSVAAQHALGRRLLVATTNLDAEESVIWDMGAIAAHGGDKALDLFGDVLVASAAIPGVFPPVMIETEGPAGPLREMHVDGAVASLFFALPAGLLPPAIPAGGASLRGQIHLIVNGKAEPGFSVTRGSIAGVLGRSYEALRKTAVRDQLVLTARLAAERGLSVDVAAIPQDAETGAADFSAATMKRLFDLGYVAAAAGRAFSVAA